VERGGERREERLACWRGKKRKEKKASLTSGQTEEKEVTAQTFRKKKKCPPSSTKGGGGGGEKGSYRRKTSTAAVKEGEAFLFINCMKKNEKRGKGYLLHPHRRGSRENLRTLRRGEKEKKNNPSFVTR